MSRVLNFLMMKKKFKKFGRPIESPTINHLAFMDGVIILCKAVAGIMKMVADILDPF